MTKFSFNQAVPFKATHPGTILKCELKEREISQKDFAALIDKRKSCDADQDTGDLKRLG